jgi:phosphomannomutase/phosphoglucomutase
VECSEDEKFGLVERAAVHFAARYPVNTIDGVRITFPKGWGLLRASNTQPVLVMRFEATDAASRDAYQAEVEDFLKTQKALTVNSEK